MPELEPITREEMLLDGQDLEPITRKEMFIKRIYDKTQVVPNPITREEMFLNKAGEGGGGDITIEQLNVTQNGTYSESGKAYSPVVVEVPVPTLTTLEVDENGTYTAPSGTAYNEVEVDVPLPENAYLLNDLSGLPADIASFADGTDLPMASLKVAVTPYQDLHGYDGPWAGGAGKNKFDIDAEHTSASGSATYTYELIVKPNTAYTMSSNVPQGNPASLYFNGGATNVNGVWSGTPRTFTSDENGKFTVFVRFNTAQGGIDLYTAVKNGTYYIQLEEGSTATSFAPYSNICPIIGWDEAVVTVADDITNKSFFDGLMNGTYGVVDLGSLNWTYSGGAFLAIVSNMKNTTYESTNIICSKYPTTPLPASQFTYGIRVYGSSSWTVMVKDSDYTDATAFKSAMNGVYLIYELETPTTPTVTPSEINELYEEFGINGHTYTIDLNGTRYGGTLDATNGTMVIDREYRVITSSELVATSALYTSARLGDNGYIDTSLSQECNMLSFHDGSGSSLPLGYFKCINSDAYNRSHVIFCFDGCRGESPTQTMNLNKEKLQTLENEGKSLTVCFGIATPITVQLSPTHVKSLEGENNIFADCGDIIKLEYFSKEV